VAASVLGIPAAAYAILLAGSFYSSLHAATAGYQRDMWLLRDRTPPAGNGLLAAALIDPVPPTLRQASAAETVPIRSLAYNESSAEVPAWLTASNDSARVPDPSILTPRAGRSRDLQCTTKLVCR
jgi:hypothetical protein